MKRTDERFIKAMERLFTDQQPVEVTMSKHQLWCLITAVQLACRHPHFNGPTRDIVEKTAKDMAAPIVANDNDLKMLLEMGWNPQFDEVRKS